MSRAVIMLADGLEECEALVVLDILRRAGAEAITASVTGNKTITSSRKVVFQADSLAEDLDFSSFDALILPGGIPGTHHLAESGIVKEQCIAFSESGRILAAICAAPSIFAALGLLEGKKATVHPSFEEKMNGAHLSHTHVACDGNIVTGQGLAAAIEFGLELAERLEGKEKAEKVAKGICF